MLNIKIMVISVEITRISYCVCILNSSSLNLIVYIHIRSKNILRGKMENSCLNQFYFKSHIKGLW